MARNLHAVFAVADTELGPQKVRVSRKMDWNAALDRFNVLADGGGRCNMGATRRVRHAGVRYFAVRSCVDPAWPGYGARIRPRDQLGRFI